MDEGYSAAKIPSSGIRMTLRREALSIHLSLRLPLLPRLFRELSRRVLREIVSSHFCNLASSVKADLIVSNEGERERQRSRGRSVTRARGVGRSKLLLSSLMNERERERERDTFSNLQPTLDHNLNSIARSRAERITARSRRRDRYRVTRKP